MTEALVEVREVSHAKGVLRDISLSLSPATLTVLAGRSGSGKSTLCHLIAGVMRPSSGSVLVNGRPAHDRPDWATVSLLPQRLALEPELSVAENVLLPAGVRGTSTGAELLDRLGLAAIAARPARDTSLGEQQRTALARALVLTPPWPSSTSRPLTRTTNTSSWSSTPCARRSKPAASPSSPPTTSGSSTSPTPSSASAQAASPDPVGTPRQPRARPARPGPRPARPSPGPARPGPLA
ncbi:ATP-binding cassette domain-containing protein [Actinoplanes sp. CA-142083]|uniref:ATP-binding cassette domain-containing protein n=1 Tax=Actinoplanes sp. CA-142083 TaxID=3239903 RepID=UPI003D89D0EB